MKQKFRASAKWKEFRKWKIEEQGGLDPITGSKLTKMAHCHHKDLNPENYENIENEANFCVLNQQTHKVLHWCLTQIKKYHSMEVIDRLVAELYRESLLNGYIEENKE